MAGGGDDISRGNSRCAVCETQGGDRRAPAQPPEARPPAPPPGRTTSPATDSGTGFSLPSGGRTSFPQREDP